MKIIDTALNKVNRACQSDKFSISIATNKKSIDSCLRLRHEVFNTETDKTFHGFENKFRENRFDKISKHIMVIEKSTNRVVATTRLLSSLDITYTGFFCLETEFDISNLHDLPGNIMEVGRICVHKDFRKGVVLGKLLQGIANIVTKTKIDYLIGCACIQIKNDDRHNIKSLMQYLRRHYFSNQEMRVHPLASLATDSNINNSNVNLPTLLKGYIRQGAVVCGEPYWNARTGVADVFVLLEIKKMNRRYSKYFSNKIVLSDKIESGLINTDSQNQNVCVN